MADQSQDRPIKVGISGLGRAGWDLHAHTLRGLPQRYQIVAVCDGLAERREQAARELGAKPYTDIDQLLADDDVELVVVAVPSHEHANQAKKALRAGKHVIVEKPFATDLAEATSMYQAADESGRWLISSQNMRFEGGFMKIQDYVESGILGELVEIRVAWQWFRRRWDWQTVRSLGGGVLANDGTHAIDQVLQLVGGDLPEVFCRLAHTPLCLGDAEDYAKIILTGPDAPIVDLVFSNVSAYPGDQWSVIGTRGSLAGGHGKFRARYIDTDLLPTREVSTAPTAGRGYNSEELPWVEETFDMATEAYTVSHQRLYRAIFEGLRTGGRNPVPPESVIRQMATIEACRAAAGEIMELNA